MSRPARDPLIPNAPVMYRIGFVLFWLIIRVLYGLRVCDDHHVPRSGPCVIAANHESAWDPPVVGLATPRFVQFMAKRELFRNRAFAALIRSVGAYPVDRGRNDVGAVKESLRRLQRGGTVGVFFEGTRRGEAKDAMNGAAFLAQRTGAALVPTAVTREGRRFLVRFGEPLEAHGRSRQETAELTALLRERVRSLRSSGFEKAGRDAGANA